MDLKEKGGILFDADAIKKIFEDPTIFALAIAPVKEKGTISNVNLKILKVYWQNNKMLADDINLTPKNGVPMVDPSKRVPPAHLEFEFSEHLKGKKFDFGFITRDQFEVLSKFEVKEIFISGVYIQFGNIRGIKGNYFSFKLEPFPKYVKILTGLAPITIGVPYYQMAIPCPPDWVFDTDKESEEYRSFWDKLNEVVNEALKN